MTLPKIIKKLFQLGMRRYQHFDKKKGIDYIRFNVYAVEFQVFSAQIFTEKRQKITDRKQ